MTRIKLLEIRDKATFIPAIAIDCSLTGNSQADCLLRRAGYGAQRCILLTSLHGDRRAAYNPFDWNDRTFHVAHLYVKEHWDEIVDGEVIDVEFIMREAKNKKLSERYT